MCCAWRAARAGCVYSGTRRHFALRPLPLACSLLPHIAPAPAPFLSTVRAAFTHAAAQSSPSGSGSTSNPASLSAGPTLAASPTTTAAWPSACRWRCAAASTSGARTASMPERYAKIKSCRGWVRNVFKCTAVFETSVSSTACDWYTPAARPAARTSLRAAAARALHTHSWCKTAVEAVNACMRL